MIEQYIDMAKEYIEDMELSRNAQVKRISALERYGKYYLRGKTLSNGKSYYSTYKSARREHKYLGDDRSEEVRNIKELRYLNHYVRRLENNINAVRVSLEQLQRTDYDAINESLPKTYRNALIGGAHSSNKATLWKERAENIKERHGLFRTQDLKIKVNDGNMVRSKSEAMIYNYLLSAGACFVYELPMSIGGRSISPDFTVLSEKGNKSEIIIEHQGMIADENYRRNFSEKLFLYLRNGYVPGVNVFFTFDDINGGFDISPIRDVVRNHIKPGSSA